MIEHLRCGEIIRQILLVFDKVQRTTGVERQCLFPVQRGKLYSLMGCVNIPALTAQVLKVPGQEYSEIACGIVARLSHYIRLASQNLWNIDGNDMHLLAWAPSSLECGQQHRSGEKRQIFVTGTVGLYKRCGSCSETDRKKGLAWESHSLRNGPMDCSKLMAPRG